MSQQIVISKPWNYLLFPLLLLYFLAGAALFLRTGSISSEAVSDGSTMVLDGTISHRFIGDDTCLEQITLFPASVPASPNASLTVRLVQGNEQDARILEQTMIRCDEMTADVPLVIPFSGRFLRYSRDYDLTLTAEGLSAGDVFAFYTTTTPPPHSSPLAYQAEFSSHKSYCLFLWKVLLVVFPITFALQRLFHVGFWRALGICVILTGLLLYGIALADCFFLIQPLFYMLSALSLLYLVHAAIRCQVIAISTADVWECAFFLILLALFALQSHGQYVWSWDALSHWAASIKNMWIFDRMPQHTLSSLQVGTRRYPPLFSLFQLLSLKLYGGYSEHILFFGKYMTEAMMGLSMLSGIKQKNRSEWYYLFALAAVLLLPQIATGSQNKLLFALYADTTLGFATGMLLISLTRYIRSGSRLSMLELAGSVFLVTLLKENGVLVILPVLASLFVLFLFRKARRQYADPFLKSMVGISAGYLISQGSWSLFLRPRLPYIQGGELSTASQMIGARFSPGVLLAYLTGNGKPWQYELLRTHPQALLTGSYYPEAIVTFSFLALLTAAITAACFMFLWNHIRLCDGKWILGFSLLTTCGVLATYHAAYTFLFYEFEAVVFASEPRYLGSYLIGLFFWIFYLFLQGAEAEHTHPWKIRVTLEVLIAVFLVVTGGYNGKQAAQDSQYMPDDERCLHAQALRNVLRETDRVYYICCGDSGGTYIRFHYGAAPIRLNSRYCTNEKGETWAGYTPRISGAEMYERQMSYEDFSAALRDYDYLYIEQVDEEFLDDYGKLFASKQEIQNGGLYRIPENTDTERLSLVRLVYE